MSVNRDSQMRALNKIGMIESYEQLQDFSFIDKAISNSKTIHSLSIETST